MGRENQMIGRRFQAGPAAWALAALLGLPGLAEAQLFPNLPIKRERVDCAHEAPIFRMYRHEYYGYHPTCWRRFPPGWGCPSPEAPNWQAELARVPLQELEPQGGAGPDGGEGGIGNEPGMEGDPTAPTPPGDQVPPVPPDDRSPFNMDLDAPIDPDAPGGASPLQDRPAPPAGGAAPANPARRPRPGAASRPAAPRRIPAIVSQPAEPPALAPAAPTLEAPTTMAPAPGPGPIMVEEMIPGGAAFPPAAPLAMGAPPASIPMEVADGAMPTLSGPPMAPSMRAPQRRGLFGSFFGRDRRAR